MQTTNKCIFLSSKDILHNEIAKIMLPYCVKEMRNSETIKEDCGFKHSIKSENTP
jgi:hypothetical protein